MTLRTKACRKCDWPIALVLLLLIVLNLHTAPAAAFDLITAEEARLPKESFSLQSGGIGRGPSIEIRGPKKGVYTASPFELEIYFKAFGGATIDPNSIEILYWTAHRRDLTRRLIPFLKDNVISIPGATAPKGQHEIQVSVTDSNGFGRTRIYAFQVD